MKHFLVLAVLLFVQDNIVVDKDLRITENSIRWKHSNDTRSTVCYDMLKGDTISIIVSNRGLAGYVFNLKLIDNQKYVNVYQWSDYPQFDGKSSAKVPVRKFKLYINKDNYKVGDTLRAKFSIQTAKSEYSEKLKIEGEVNHVIYGKGFNKR